MSWRRVLVGPTAVLLVSATVAVGCSGQGDSGLAGPGTPIVNGFEVAEGTRLVGRALPDIQRTDYDEAPGEAWVALLLVEGDPAEAFDAYVTQAGDMGVPMGSAYTTTACAAGWGTAPLVDARDITYIDPRGQDLPITCEVFGMDVPWDVAITLATTGPGTEARWAGSIVLRVRKRGSTPGPTRNNEALLGAFGDALPTSGDAPPPPSTGEQLAPGDESVIRDLRVPDGTTVLTTAATGSYWGSWTAVLHTEREPEALLTELLRGKPSAHPTDVVRSMIGEEAVWSAWWDEAGGDKLYGAAMGDGDGGWFVLVDATTDH